MKVAGEIVVGREYIIVFEGAPLVVKAGLHYFENENRSFSRLCNAWELPEPPPAPPATLKLGLDKLRGILKKAEKLQDNIFNLRTVKALPLGVRVGTNISLEFEGSSGISTAIRETLLRKLGEELNDLLTLKADASDEP